MAKRLLAAAVTFQTEHQARLNVPNTGVRVRKRGGGTRTIYPNPSKPGEYPHKITGAGQAGLVYQPTTAQAIKAEGLKVRIGHRINVKYMTILELYWQRKGLRDTVKETKDQIKAVVAVKRN